MGQNVLKHIPAAILSAACERHFFKRAANALPAPVASCPALQNRGEPCRPIAARKQASSSTREDSSTSKVRAGRRDGRTKTKKCRFGRAKFCCPEFRSGSIRSPKRAAKDHAGPRVGSGPRRQ